METAQDLIHDFNTGVIVLPDYQRAYTWNKSKERNFINFTRDTQTLLSSVVVIETGPKTFEIIDGQHRVITLKKAIEQPEEYGLSEKEVLILRMTPVPVVKIKKNLNHKQRVDLFIGINTNNTTIHLGLLLFKRAISDINNQLHYLAKISKEYVDNNNKNRVVTDKGVECKYIRCFQTLVTFCHAYDVYTTGVGMGTIDAHLYSRDYEVYNKLDKKLLTEVITTADHKWNKKYGNKIGAIMRGPKRLGVIAANYYIQHQNLVGFEQYVIKNSERFIKDVGKTQRIVDLLKFFQPV